MRAPKLPKTPRGLYPRKIETEYNQYLLDFVQELIDATDKILIPMLPSLEKNADMMLGLDVMLDAWPDDLQDAINSIDDAVNLGFWTSKENLERFAVDVNQFNRNEFNRIVNSVLGVDIFQNEKWLTTISSAFSIENANLITSIKQDYLKEVSTISFEALKTGTPSKQLATEIKTRYKVTQSRANLIARDQISKLNGQINQVRQVEAGLESYRWQTAEDGAVRESHAEKDGNIYQWGNPPADTGHPGQDYQCRCIAVPIFDGQI